MSLRRDGTGTINTFVWAFLELGMYEITGTCLDKDKLIRTCSACGQLSGRLYIGIVCDNVCLE